MTLRRRPAVPLQRPPIHERAIAGEAAPGVSPRSSAALPRQAAEPATEKPQKSLPPWPVTALLATWLLPWQIEIGSLRLTPYRIVLLSLLVPCIVWWLRGKAGRVRIADFTLLLFALWSLISLSVLRGPQVAIQSGGINFVETMGSFLIARCCIRNEHDFYALVRMLFWLIVLLLPFALIESITRQNVSLDLLSKVLPTLPFMSADPRWGLRRAQTVFEHPILMGVCCSSVLALTFAVLGRDKSFGKRWGSTAVIVFTAGLSLSSGPWSGMALQMVLLAWNWVLRAFKPRWKLLIALVACFVLLVQLFAKRPLPNILFSFALDGDSAFFRLLIWNFGTQSVANHPWFGTGPGEWDRPSWMGASIDMFWLYNAVTFGLPGGILMMATFFAVVLSLARLKNLNDKLYQYRAAFLMCMASFFLEGWMVHFWNSTYVLFLLLLGSGVWLLDAPQERMAAPARPAGGEQSTPRRRSAARAEPVSSRAKAGLQSDLV